MRHTVACGSESTTR